MQQIVLTVLSKKSFKRMMNLVMNWLTRCHFIGENPEITFSEVEPDFRNRVGSIVRKSMGSVSSSGSHETLKGSMSKSKGNYMQLPFRKQLRFADSARVLYMYSVQCYFNIMINISSENKGLTVPLYSWAVTLLTNNLHLKHFIYNKKNN